MTFETAKRKVADRL